MCASFKAWEKLIRSCFFGSQNCSVWSSSNSKREWKLLTILEYSIM